MGTVVSISLMVYIVLGYSLRKALYGASVPGPITHRSFLFIPHSNDNYVITCTRDFFEVYFFPNRIRNHTVAYSKNL